MSGKDVQLSKRLSWLLRHAAEQQGLKMDDGGYVDVASILRLKQFRRYTEVDIRNVVETNDKKRFSLREENGKLRIRANQGHSVAVNEENLLTELGADDLPENVVHGTFLRNWNRIRQEGIRRMNRNHIHFSPGLPGEEGVISGIRKNCQVTILVDARKALEDGIKFYRSDNNVILSPGDQDGILLPKYFREAVEVKTKKVLYTI
ncbi:tRNA 2'-phosphotransferase 1-like [Centruroides sculpturatus]|uniref:tRNA 2'-phosphotransferase 1-like n=1 Tax=Centruroides sculpturatus TaxID=218467 RepID=UPI000C6D6054|nr:tRNA 2'-phosphotransferase 1-like [Centruroides sculpturatus]